MTSQRRIEKSIPVFFCLPTTAMKKFDVYSQTFATFREGCISGFRFIGSLQAFSAGDALEKCKIAFPKATLPMVEPHVELQDYAHYVQKSIRPNKEFAGTKRVWR